MTNMTYTDRLDRAARAAVSERNVVDYGLLHAGHGRVCFSGNCGEPRKLLEGNGKFTVAEDTIVGKFKGKPGSYQLIVKTPVPMNRANGVTVRYRVDGWDQIRYLAIGHTDAGAFRHVKISNPSQGEWVTFSVGYGDIAFALKNNWEHPDASLVGDVRLYVSGTPADEGSNIEFSWASIWLESADQNPPPIAYLGNSKLFHSLKRYFTKCNPKIEEQVEKFLKIGACPMVGETELDWPADQPRPDGIAESGTYRYIWHAMQPVISMLVYADDHQEIAPVFSARDYINDWLERSFFKVDPDEKFTWYDHGTAERLMAFLLMHEVAFRYNFDNRFLSRLQLAIIRHGQLLESEVFYAYHQPTRYHNHAWFQDMALMAAAVALPDLSCSSRWLDRAIERLLDQLDQLIVRDSGFAIFVENSIGYHHGIQRLVAFGGELADMSGRETNIAKIATELTAWSGFLRYPDGRSPSQGDTLRKPNPMTLENKLLRGKPYADPFAKILKKAGYAVLKGNHENQPFMLCLFATSLCKTHKHEDNLSFTLWFDGVEWLTDPSFYSHDYNKSIPAYLRRAESHNNIFVPGLKYSLEPGRSSLEGLCANDCFNIEGRHWAYERLVVRRNLRCDIYKLSIRGADSVEFNEKNPACSGWLVFHFGEGVSPVRIKKGIGLVHPKSGYEIDIQLDMHNPHMNFQIGETTQGLSVSGVGFEEAVDTWSVKIAVPDDGVVGWSINARKQTPG